MLTFVIPVRHHATASNWDAIKSRLDVTLRSLRAQDDPRWNAIIIANDGADLPADLSACWIVRVDLPPNKLDHTGPQQALWEAIRRDKGRRLLAGLVRGREAGLLTGHVMVVDYDDVVSRRLAGFVAQHPNANGWYVDAGYMFSGRRLAFSCPHEFFELCGTSHIVRADLLGLPEREEDADEAYVCRRLGSHKFIKRDLEAQGTPLAPLPFPGAIYRMGHADTASGSSAMIRYNLRKESLTKPVSLAKQLAKFRYVGPGMAREFFGGTPA
ncbi:MAG: hypothetical protein AB7E79_12935 [Rhodospirillaceae bacterium]